MKNISILFSLVILCALALIPSAQAAVDLSVTPANITNDYVGKVTLTMTGLSAGQTVRVERFTDVNGNGVVEAATDGLFRSFTVADGQLPMIGGVRNLNVPGDDDGVVNGQIRVDLDSPGIDNVFGTASGNFIYRVSDPVNGFTPVTRTFTVAQKVYSQGIRGRVTAAAGGAPLGGAFVVLLDANGHGIGGASTDANGNYVLNTLPGSYLIFPLRPDYIADQTSGGATVVANQFTTNNQGLATGPFTISGRLTDATSGAGIAGVFILGQSANNLLSISAPTDTNGNYSFAASASEWEIGTPGGGGLAQLGYLSQNDFTTNITTASAANVNFALPKATALIYGTVKDNLNNPVNGVGTWANEQARNYEVDGRSLAPNANYTLGVVAGTWFADVQSDDLPAGYTAGPGTNVTLSAGQAVQANFIVQPSCVHLLGKVVNTSGSPQSDLEIQVNSSSGGNTVAQAVTAGDGSFDLGVSAGSWQVSLDFDDSATNLIGPTLTFDNVTCGVNVSNINVVVRSVTAQITGTITSTTGNPVTGMNLYVYAFATINGTKYHEADYVDGSGHFSIGVANGTWEVSVECSPLNSLGYNCMNNQTVTISGANGVANFVASPLNNLQITTGTALPGATVNTTYNAQLQASGGTPAYAWSLLSGSLPNGLFLNSGNGVISGTPSVNGTFNFTIKVTDAANQTATRAFSLVVNAGSGADVVFYAVSKQASFVQTDAGAPSPESNLPFRFSASVHPSTPTSVTTASVQLPGGSTQALGYSSSEKQFGFKASYSSQSELDVAYPAGNYGLSFNAVRDGSKTLTLSLPAASFPNAPRISNFSAAQAIDPSAGFLLTWDAFTGGTSGDFISVSIQSLDGQDVLSTADIWEPGSLDGMVTGIQIPANTLAAGQTYSAKVQFAKGTRDTATYPGALGAVAFLAKTKVNIATSTPPGLISYSPASGASGGQFQLSLNGNATKSYTIEFSTNLINWLPLVVTNPPNAQPQYLDFPKNNKAGFYRAYESGIVVAQSVFSFGASVVGTPVFYVNVTNGIALIPITRTNGLSTNACVHYSTRDGTAIGGCDYTPTSGTLCFSSNVTSNSISIPVSLGCSTTNQPATVNLQLSEPNGTVVLNAVLVIQRPKPIIGIFPDASFMSLPPSMRDPVDGTKTLLKEKILLPSNSPQSFAIGNVGPQGSVLNYRVVHGNCVNCYVYQNDIGSLQAGEAATVTFSVSPGFVDRPFGGPSLLIGSTSFFDIYTPQKYNNTKSIVEVQVLPDLREFDTVHWEGHVYVSCANPTPVAGVVVSTDLDSQTVTTDATGHFDLVAQSTRTNLCCTPYTILFTKQGYPTQGGNGVWGQQHPGAKIYFSCP